MGKKIEGTVPLLRFIHAADLHLGSPARGVNALPGRVRQLLLEAPYKAYNLLIETAIKEKVDFVLLAGDLFDQANPSLKAQVQFIKGMARLNEAGIKAFICLGNHDPAPGTGLLQELPPNVHLFSHLHVERIPFIQAGELKAAVYGISYPTPRVTENLALRFKRDPQDPVAIGLLHTNCGGLSGHDHYAPSTVQDLLQAGMDYWALGHVHTRQMMHEDPPIVYPGNLQGRHSQEQGKRGFFMVTFSSEQGWQLTFKEAPFVSWEVCSLPVADFQSWDELEQIWQVEREKLSRTSCELVMVQIVAQGDTPLAHGLADHELREEWLEAWQQEGLDRVPLIWPYAFEFQGSLPYDRENLRRSGTWQADLIQLVDHYLEERESLASLAQSALAELYGHPRAKRYLTELDEKEVARLLCEAERLVFSWLERGKADED